MKFWVYVSIIIIFNHYSTCFRYISTFNTKSKLNELYLFNFFNNNKDNSKVQPVTTVDLDKVDKLRNNLEKISNKQNRNYEAEAIANAPRKKEIADKQLLSFNFNKADEFPNLYKGWIRSDGDQIAKQMISATKAALSKNEKYIEVLFDPVPNLDEVAFGTEWNKRLRKDVVADLKVPDYATNRGGPSTLEWSTLYWANRLCTGALTNKKVLLISISGEGTKGNYLPTFGKGVRLVTLSESKKEVVFNTGDVYDAMILLSPCQESHYLDGKKLADKYNIPLIALNAPYSYRYDVGGGKPFNLVYVMKRIPKGWIYRQYPKPFEAIIEGPNYEVFRAKTFDVQPKLPEISKISMKASSEKYGNTGNDRIFQNRL